MQLYYCYLSNNRADYGGAIYAYGTSSSTVKVYAENSILQENSASMVVVVCIYSMELLH